MWCGRYLGVGGNLKQTITKLNNMSKRKTYHVTKTDDGWQGKLEGGKKASVKGETKAEVVKKTIDLAKNQEKTPL